MPDTYTTTASSGLDHAAYNLAIDYALRKDLYFVPLADVRATNQAHPGTSVTFSLVNDLAIASTALDESTDVSAVAISDTTVTLTLAEQGNAIIYTQKLAGTSLVSVDPVFMNVVNRNAAESMDELASIVLRGGTNVFYAGAGSTGRTAPTARNTIEPEDTLTAKDVRKAVTQLRSAAAPDFNGFYMAFIHPDVSYDFQSDTDVAGWVQPSNYSAAERRWAGDIGTFGGARFIETPRSPLFADAGSSTTLTDVYATIVMGRQAMAKAYAYTGGWREDPQVVIGPVTDKLERFRPIGWKWFGAFGRYREACLRRIESSSSIGANTP